MAELVNESQTRKTLKIEIEPDAIRKAFNEISKRYAKIATIPGFRPGNAPVNVVQTRYKDEIQNEVLREIVPNKINAAIQEHELNVLGEPEIHLENESSLKLDGSEPVQVHVHVEVMPDVTLGEYKGLEATKRLRPTTEDEITQMIDSLREAYTTLEPVEDRASEIGDTVTANFTGKFLDDPDAEPINVEEADVELGGENVEVAFTEHLTGLREDEEKTFVIEYPEDFTSPGLAGKKIEYTAKVISVRKKTLPEIDDEWVKSLDEPEVDTVDKLKERIKSNLEMQSQMESDSKLRVELLNKMIDSHDIEVPSKLVQYQVYQLSESLARDLYNRGIDPRQQPREFWERAMPSLEKQATRDLRGSMLLEAIADAENIEPTEEEIEQEIEAIAQASNQSIEQVHATLTKENRERSIADRLRNRKALDFLVDNANITEGEWREEEEEVADDDEATVDAEFEEAQTSNEEEVQTDDENAPTSKDS